MAQNMQQDEDGNFFGQQEGDEDIADEQTDDQNQNGPQSPGQSQQGPQGQQQAPPPPARPPPTSFKDGTKMSPKDRMKACFLAETETASKLEVCGFATCLLAEQILIGVKTPLAMGVNSEIPLDNYNAESIASAVAAAVQIINTKGKKTNAKGETIKVTTNFVSTSQLECKEVTVELDYYETWKQICAALDFDLAEKGNMKVVNEMLAGEAVYKDLENITGTQQTGAAKAQLGNEAYYPHYLGSGSKSATMAAKIEYCGWMAGLNEVLRAKNALASTAGNKGPNGETEGMINYMIQALVNRLSGGQSWVVNTLADSATNKDKSVTNSLKSCLGQYLSKFPPSRALPDLPQLVVFYFGTLLHEGKCGEGPFAPWKDFNRSHQIFNMAFYKTYQVNMLFISHEVSPNIAMNCWKLEVLFVHYSGMTFGNLDICNKYLKFDCFKNGFLSIENLLGGLTKMGKFNYWAKSNLKPIPCFLHNEFKWIEIDFKRKVKSAGVERMLAPSLPVDLSGDANYMTYIAAPVTTTEARVASYEYAEKMAQVCQNASVVKEVKGQVTSNIDYFGIIMNYSPRKHGPMTAMWQNSYSQVLGISVPQLKKYTKEQQEAIVTCACLMFEEAQLTGSYQDGSVKRKALVTVGKKFEEIDFGQDIWKKYQNLTKEKERQAKKLKRSTGYAPDGFEV